MRFLVVTIGLLILTTGLNAQTSAPSAADVLQPVYAKAAQENKRVLLIFHASWCGWCRKMFESLADDAVKPLINKYYKVAHLRVHESDDKKNLENPGAMELLARLGGADSGLPYWAVLDAKGKALANSQYKPGKNTGCPAGEEEVAYFIRVLRKTSKLGEVELKVIEERFRRNEQ